uniref:UDP-glucuronosyltransferase n=1 Tax=Globodera pallida TaxID=36090 RepID=A0A183BVN5_GLOPA
MGLPMAVGPEMINVGARCEESKTLAKLPNEFSVFMENPSSNGTIYVAFGTHVDWKYAPEHVLNALFRAFGRLNDYQIIFACKGCVMPKNLSKNVMIVAWAPQHQVLAHPTIKAFITHGGLKSVREGICAGIPLIVMPVTAEQAHNAHVLLKMRIARAVINKFYITEPNLFNTINSVLSRSDELLARAKKVREIFLDRPIPAMDEGIFAVEHRIFDNKFGTGWARYTQRKGMLLGWTEFAYLHLIATIFVSLIIISW